MLASVTIFRQQKSYDACFTYFWQDLHQRRSASLFHTTWSYQWPSRSGNNRRSPVQTPTSFAVTINRVSVARLFPVDRAPRADRGGLDWTRLVSEAVPKSVTAAKACAACPVSQGGTKQTWQGNRAGSVPVATAVGLFICKVNKITAGNKDSRLRQTCARLTEGNVMESASCWAKWLS